MYNYNVLLPALVALSSTAAAAANPQGIPVGEVVQLDGPEIVYDGPATGDSTETDTVGSATTLPGTVTPTTLPGTSTDWTATLPVETEPTFTSLPGTSRDWPATLPVEPEPTYTILPIDLPSSSEGEIITTTQPIGTGTPPWWATPGPSHSPTGSRTTLLPTGSSSVSPSPPVFTGAAVVAMNAPAFYAAVGVFLGAVAV
ncbi:uncharacterized protein BDV17DRAFT_137751 [Aspergillus undulatus]|uniref:uncharacterized protein n=1 Tax=Aspergillus undulatus TaxID=1810928 RepID=UPI003CCCC3C3